MGLSTGWVIFIIVVVFAIIIGNITLLKKSNKAFDFPDGFEKKKTDKSDDDNSSSHT